MKFWTFLACLLMVSCLATALSAQRVGGSSGGEKKNTEEGESPDEGDSPIPDEDDAGEDEVIIETGSADELKAVQASLKGVDDYIGKTRATQADLDNFIKLAPALATAAAACDKTSLVDAFKAMLEHEAVKKAMMDNEIAAESMTGVYRVFVILLRDKGIERAEASKAAIKEMADMLKEMGMEDAVKIDEANYNKCIKEYEKLTKANKAEQTLIDAARAELDAAFATISPDAEMEDCEDEEMPEKD